MESSSCREFSLRGSAWQRGAAGLVALVACGFFAPKALAAPTAPSANAPLASASTFDEEIPAPDPVATSTTDQSAGSTATATQQQPVNVVVIVRVDSPGNDGSITQNNIAVASSNAANTASTAQDGGGGAASTSQQATATATASQDTAGNLVITVRMDSPGTNGAVSQTNGVVGASSGTNTSDTAQQVAAPKPAVQPQARRAGAAGSRKPVRRQQHPTSAVSPPLDSSTPQVATPQAQPTATTPPRAAMRQTSAHRHPVMPKPRSRERHGTTLSSIAGGAVRALTPFMLQTPPVADTTGPSADISRPVLLTLLLLAAAAAAFALIRRAVTPRHAVSRRPPG